MKVYQLKVTVKKSKPPIWWRIWIPAGITFSALSMLLDEITAGTNSSAFCFSIYQQLELYEATEEKPLAPGGFHYDAQEASSTYIDDYFDSTKRFSYEADGLQASIEVEKVFADGEISAPMLVKTTAQTDGAAVNERLASHYSLSEGESAFLRKSEIAEFANAGHCLFYTTSPESAKNNLVRSASHMMQDTADVLRKALGLDAPLDPDSTERPIFRRSNIPLRNLLVEETVPKLRKMAVQFSIPHFSVMEKPELCRHIAEQLLKPENMRQQFLSLTEDETAAFDHLIEMGGEWKPDDDRILDAYRNLRIMHYAFLFKDNTVMVPNEVAEAYRQILTPEFCEERQKIHWIENILYSILPPYYGYMPIERFCRLCSRKENPTIQPDEVMPLYHKIQPEFNTSFLEDDWIADEELRDEKAFQNVQHQHADKPYARIPTKEIETLLKYGYPIHDPYYGKLKIYLLRETTVNADIADDLLHDLHLRIAYGADMDDIFSCLQENGIMFSKKSLEGFLPLLQDAFNHTRTFANCGYSPSDIRELLKTENCNEPCFIAPMSTTAANLLNASEPDLNRRGISVDLHSTSMLTPNNTSGKPNRKANKVYPNDPCPCGSGKKYKKCCGRLA